MKAFFRFIPLIYNLIYSSFACVLSCFLSSKHLAAISKQLNSKVSFPDNGFLCCLNKGISGCKHSIDKTMLPASWRVFSWQSIPGQTHLVCFTWWRESQWQFRSQVLASEGYLQICWGFCFKNISFKIRWEERNEKGFHPDGNVFLNEFCL